MNGKSVSNAVWFLALPFGLVVLPGSALASVITTGDVDLGGAATQPEPWEVGGDLKIGVFGNGTPVVEANGEVGNADGYIGYKSGQLPLATAINCDSLRVSANAVLFYNAGCKHPLRHASRSRVSGLRNRRSSGTPKWAMSASPQPPTGI